MIDVVHDAYTLIPCVFSLLFFLFSTYYSYFLAVDKRKRVFCDSTKKKRRTKNTEHHNTLFLSINFKIASIANTRTYNYRTVRLVLIIIYGPYFFSFHSFVEEFFLAPFQAYDIHDTRLYKTYTLHVTRCERCTKKKYRLPRGQVGKNVAIRAFSDVFVRKYFARTHFSTFFSKKASSFFFAGLRVDQCKYAVKASLPWKSFPFYVFVRAPKAYFRMRHKRQMAIIATTGITMLYDYS